MRTRVVLFAVTALSFVALCATQRMGVSGSTGAIQPGESGTLSSRCLDEHDSAPSTDTYYTQVFTNDPKAIVVKIGKKDPIPLQQAIDEGKVSITGITPYGYSSRYINEVVVNNLTEESITVTVKKFTALGTKYHQPIGYDVSQLSGLSQRELWNRQENMAEEQRRQAEEKERQQRLLSLQTLGKEQLKVLRKNMVYIPGGKFMMGQPVESDALIGKPLHQVTLSPYYIHRYEVTQALWAEIMGTVPSNFTGENLPVEQVNWTECVDFCNKLSQRDGLTPCYKVTGEKVTCNFQADGYRLPTEAEWEFAAKGGNHNQLYTYSGSGNIAAVAWYQDNSNNNTHVVGTRSANEVGLFDMSGNVLEWVWDIYTDYTGDAQTDPRGASSGTERISRGGSWKHTAEQCNVNIRFKGSPAEKNYTMGLRLCRTGK
jgi:formylglycine-generating enzyme